MYRPSINACLRNTHHVLKYELSQDPSLIGAGVMGLSDIYTKVRRFVEEFQRFYRRTNGAGVATFASAPAMYLVRLDIKSCFDTIQQEKLFHILQNGVLRRDTYSIQGHSIIYPSVALQQVQTKHVKTVTPPFERKPFIKLASSVAHHHRDSLMLDHLHQNTLERQEILDTLREHLFNNKVGIDGVIYHQHTGIPQGSILSTLLCNFYYATIENKFFQKEIAVPAQDQNCGEPLCALHALSKNADATDITDATNVKVGVKRKRKTQNEDRNLPAASRPNVDDVKVAVPPQLLMRLTDDFLLATPCLRSARNFARILHLGLPEYGCEVNPAKTLVNFDMTVQGVLLKRFDDVEGNSCSHRSSNHHISKQ